MGGGDPLTKKSAIVYSIFRLPQASIKNGFGLQQPTTYGIKATTNLTAFKTLPILDNAWKMFLSQNVYNKSTEVDQIPCPHCNLQKGQVFLEQVIIMFPFPLITFPLKLIVDYKVF